MSETDFKYLDIILDSITLPKKDGMNYIWKITTENIEVTFTATFDKDSGEWIYTIS